MLRLQVETKVWAYPVRQTTKGKPRQIGYVYFWVALEPSHHSGNDEFQPYLALWFEQENLETSVDWDQQYLDWNHPWSPDEDFFYHKCELFPSWCLRQAFFSEDEAELPSGFTAYFPLVEITAGNIKQAVIDPLVCGIIKLIKNKNAPEISFEQADRIRGS